MRAGRFYNHHSADPYFNMAVDEWMFTQVQAKSGSGDLSVRLYSWSEPAITFGFNQDAGRAFDESQVRSTPVIRRMTGGRAIYHDRSELTYSVVVDLSNWTDHPWASGISPFYRRVAEALTAFVTACGREGEYCRRSADVNARGDFFHKAPCFASSARYEVMADGSKLVASAARRVGSTILQHGSIKLNGVALHPALPPVAGNHQGGLQPVRPEQWGEICGTFRRIVSQQLEVDLVPAEFDSDQMSEQKERAEAVRKAARRRRFF